MFTYVLLALIGLSVWYPLPWVLPAMAAIIILLANLFYYLMFNCVSGLVVVELDTGASLNELWTNRAVEICSVIFLFAAGGYFPLVAAFAVPWIAVNTMSVVLTTMVRLDIVSIEKRDDDQ